MFGRKKPAPKPARRSAPAPVRRPSGQPRLITVRDPATGQMITRPNPNRPMWEV